MRKLTPISSVLAALMIASVLSGCGGGGAEPINVPVGSDSQITTDAVAKAAAEAAAAEAAAAETAATELAATEAAAAAAAEKATADAAAKKAADAAAAKAAADAAAAKKAKAAAAAKAAAVAAAAEAAAPPPAPPVADVYYANCTEVRAAGADPIHRGDPGYSSKLDRDGDGIACE